MLRIKHITYHRHKVVTDPNTGCLTITWQHYFLILYYFYFSDDIYYQTHYAPSSFWGKHICDSTGWFIICIDELHYAAINKILMDGPDCSTVLMTHLSFRWNQTLYFLSLILFSFWSEAVVIYLEKSDWCLWYWCLNLTSCWLSHKGSNKKFQQACTVQ